MLSLLLSIFFGYTQGQCDICSWPYSAGVNSKGECYLVYQGSQPGFQGGLESGCYVYCDAWARSISTQQTATPMLSFSQGAGGVSCQCQRLNSYSEIEYKTRPSGSCDWGYSDIVQGFYDSVAVNYRSQNNSQILNVSNRVTIDSFFSQFQRMSDARYVMNSCSPRDGHVNPVAMMYHYTDDYNGVDWASETDLELPNGMTCNDLYAGKSGSLVVSAVSKIQGAIASQDTAMLRVNNAIDAVQRSVSSGQSSILEALAQLQAKPSGGGGSVNPADLSGVLAAIDSSERAVLEGQKVLGDSLSDLKTMFSARMLTLSNKTDTMSMNILALTDSVSGLKSGISDLNKSTKSVNQSVHAMDSGLAARHKSDHESDSSAYQKVLDSLNGSGGSGVEAAAKVSEFQALADQGSGHNDDALSNIARIQNLSGCSDVPVLTADLGSLGLGVVSIDLAHYAYVVSLSRFVFRFLGGFAALMLVLGALRVLAIPSNGR